MSAPSQELYLAMSDFLLSNEPGCAAEFADILNCLSRVCDREVDTWQGSWGSLAAHRNHYPGYCAYEDEISISLVIGGPLLRIGAVSGRRIHQSNRHTVSVLQHVFENRSGSWHDDLLGPFCFLRVDKLTGTFSIVTDNLAFVPAYVGVSAQSTGDNRRIFSTHADAAALAAGYGHPVQCDPVSVCDFVANGKVTYPHTLYANVTELAPATVHSFAGADHSERVYWRPENKTTNSDNLEDVADAARQALTDLIQHAADEYGRLCFLLSAGEDSRMLASMAPPDVAMHCFTVAPAWNREARIAKQVAQSLNASWEFIEQPISNYVRNLASRALLSGSNGLSIHAHMLGILRNTSLRSQPVVIGGFTANAFLKGHFYNTRRVIPFVDYRRLDHTDSIELQSRTSAAREELLAEVRVRQRRHKKQVQEFRTMTVNEWMKCWPMSQDHECVNLWSNRRLFTSLEAFTCPAILDIAASLPPDWVTNRKLFQKIAAPCLRKTRWLPHGEGHLPAFPWYMNVVMRPAVRIARRVRRLGRREHNAYAWPSTASCVDTVAFKEGLSEVARRHVDGDVASRFASAASRSPTATPRERFAAVQVMATMDALVCCQNRLSVVP